MPKRGLDEPDLMRPDKIRRLGHDPRKLAEELLASLTSEQLAELTAPFSPTIQPSKINLSQDESSESEIPYMPLEAIQDGGRGQPAFNKADRETARKLRLMEELETLPRDVQIEYLGPNFDFENTNALDAYEFGLGVDRLSRISCYDQDIPDAIVQLHPHLFVDMETFEAFASCVRTGHNNTGVVENLWNRGALFESRPYRSEDVTRGLCKRQQMELEAELSAFPLLAIEKRAGLRSKYDRNKLVDARTYATWGSLIGPTAELDHLPYLRSKMPMSAQDANQLIDHNKYRPWKTPDIVARKGNHTFITGDMMKASCDLLKANTFELHDPSQVQLKRYYPSGTGAGEYISLFTHARGNFPWPNKMQTEQLGLPPDYEYKKETELPGEKYKHRQQFYESLKTPDGVHSAMEKSNPYMYRRVDFDALLKSDYHRIRVAVALLEDSKPFDLDRCERIKGLLDLDENLHYRSPVVDRRRERDAARG